MKNIKTAKSTFCIALMLCFIYLTACAQTTDVAGETIEGEPIRMETVSDNEPAVSVSDGDEGKSQTAEKPEMEEENDMAEGTEITQDLENAARREPVHGIYLSANVAGSTQMMEEYLTHLDESGINAVVIDVKNDEGRVTWETGTPIVEELGSTQRLIRDMPGLIKTLHEHEIYVIGRCVTFREMYLYDVKKEWLIKNTDGTAYRDKKGFSWIDPTNEEAWKYLEEICAACAEVGFDEIQFDYVRYGTGVKEEMIGLDGAGKQEAINAYASHMKEVFEKLQIPYSLDVFGIVINSEIDREIVGQNYASLAEQTDFLSPMVYPSHYYDGSYDIAHPDEKPSETIPSAMADSNMVLGEVDEEKRAGVRPWLQAFTASYLAHYIKYGGEEIRAQIRATYEAGYDEWLLWNPACKYPWEELTTELLPDFDEVQEQMKLKQEQ